MAKFYAAVPIEHDGDRYAEGEALDIKSKAQSDALLAGGQIITEAQYKANVAAAEAAAKAAAAEAEQPPA